MIDKNATDINAKVLEALVSQQGDTLKALVSMMDRKFAEEAKDRASALAAAEQERLDRKELLSTLMASIPTILTLFAGKKN